MKHFLLVFPKAQVKRTKPIESFLSSPKEYNTGFYIFRKDKGQ